MNFSERLLEASEERLNRDTEAAVKAIRAQLAEEGEDICVTCDEPIEPERKAVMPSAIRCAECQRLTERKARVTNQS